MQFYILPFSELLRLPGENLMAYNLRVSPETVPPSFSELEVFSILTFRDEKGIPCFTYRFCWFVHAPFPERRGFLYKAMNAVVRKVYVMQMKRLFPVQGKRPAPLSPRWI